MLAVPELPVRFRAEFGNTGIFLSRTVKIVVDEAQFFQQVPEDGVAVDGCAVVSGEQVDRFMP